MHTNKYLEKIAEYDWNDAPRDMGVGMVTDARRGDFNKKASEIPHEDVAVHTLLNKITNPISWAAKIDLSGNTSTRVAALALNTLAREVNHQ